MNTNLKTTEWAGKNPDWTKYHSAWQNYYQKYYSDYYARAAQNYVQNVQNEQGKAQKNLNAEKIKLEAEKQKLRKSRAGLTAVALTTESTTKPTAESTIGPTGPATGLTPEAVAEAKTPDETAAVEENLRSRIQKIARTDRKKRARRRKFIPLILGLTTVLVLLFLQYNRLIFAPIVAYVSPGNANGSTITEIDPTISVAVSPNPTLLIPKLNIDVPIVFGIDATDTNAVMAAMNSDGVVHFRIAGASAYPGEFGNLVITGHSAGDVYSNNQYKFIFSGLERLAVDDKVYVDFNGVRYTYSVKETKIIDPKSVTDLQLGTDKPRLTLVTCWPLGTSEKRLIVIADQINPTPTLNPTEPTPESTPTPEPTTSSETLPENEATFFDGLWSWLTNS